MKLYFNIYLSKTYKIPLSTLNDLFLTRQFRNNDDSCFYLRNQFVISEGKNVIKITEIIKRIHVFHAYQISYFKYII